MQSPWSSNALQSVLFSDIFGELRTPVTRAEAMSVPAVAKARHLICGLGAQPLRAYEGEQLAAEQPAWLASTSSQTPPQTRMSWTLDDLFFGGWSLWQVERDGTTTADPITDAVRVPPEWWEFDDGGAVLLDGRPATAAEVILFSGPYEGLLEAGQRTIRGARNLEDAWAKRVQSPIPLVSIVQTTSDEELDVLRDPEGEPVVDEHGEEIDEAQQIVQAYVDARRDPNGAVAFIPFGYELAVHGDVKHELFVEGRNAVTLDVARYAAIPGNLLDASMSTASLTYTTTQGGRSDFNDMTAAFWLGPINARLSMDDVVPAGQRIAFDLSNLTAVPATGLAPATED
ncbi:phage portal protein [Cellulomonas sp. A375-1]|uniref:phage portal protein n=1 Tax=Cellulomonas sp. A375-1 TaxID=1672219 RepID=UPI00069DA979|nr:phage portal protein [Cellulomonas sp. A375-1]